MGQNQFIESLVELMLSWMRWLTGWFWSIVNSEGISGGGFLSWFAGHWVSIAVFLIVVGVIVDWLIWMIRWRPYWLWLRKRQIIYEEVPVARKKRRPAPRPALASDAPADEYDDPFAEPMDDPYASQPADDMAEWDSHEDPYAPSAASEPMHKKVDLNHSRPVQLRERMNRTNVDDRQ